MNTDIAALRKRNEELIENINHLENEKRLEKISPNQSQDLEVNRAGDSTNQAKSYKNSIQQNSLPKGSG